MKISVTVSRGFKAEETRGASDVLNIIDTDGSWSDFSSVSLHCGTPEYAARIKRAINGPTPRTTLEPQSLSPSEQMEENSAMHIERQAFRALENAIALYGDAATLSKIRKDEIQDLVGALKAAMADNVIVTQDWRRETLEAASRHEA